MASAGSWSWPSRWSARSERRQGAEGNLAREPQDSEPKGPPALAVHRASTWLRSRSFDAALAPKGWGGRAYLDRRHRRVFVTMLGG